MSAMCKTAANLLVKMKEEFDYLENELGLNPIGVCRDVSGDEQRCRADLRKEHPSVLVADYWAHQVCLPSMVNHRRVSLSNRFH
jgi:hypothetical protein